MSAYRVIQRSDLYAFICKSKHCNPQYIKYSALSPDTATWQLLATDSVAGEGYLEVNPHSLGLLSGTIIVLTQCLRPWHTPGTIALLCISV